MNLARSPAGLSASYLFYQVDAVVFCEGGTSITLDLMAEGGGDDGTPDAQFWRQILSQFSNRTFHVRSVGSKQLVRDVAQQIYEGGVQNVIACMDSDYEGIFSTKIEHDRVLYTYGYSWENDSLGQAVVSSIFDALNGTDVASTQRRTLMNETIDVFIEEACPFIEMDCEFIRQASPGLIPRDRPLFCVDIAGAPQLRIDAIKAMLVERGSASGPDIQHGIAIERCRSAMFGHFLARMIYHAVVHHSDGRARGLRYSVFIRLAISEFIRATPIGGSSDIRDYYLAAVRGAVA